jgi:hypothetical protein
MEPPIYYWKDFENKRSKVFHILHLKLWTKNYGQKKNQESNCQTQETKVKWPLN